MVIRTTKAVADLVDFELNGATVQAVADLHAEVPADGAADTRDYLYTLAGPIADGDLIAKVDQYAAGTFSFAMDVTTTDGADTSTLAVSRSSSRSHRSRSRLRSRCSATPRQRPTAA